MLSALAARGDLPAETVSAMLDSASTIGSDFEQGEFLVQVAGQRPIGGTLLEPFFRAVAAVDSSFERSRVLRAVVDRPDVPPDVLISVLQAVGRTNGSFEASQVLQSIAAHHTLTGQARDLYIDMAGRLGRFEQDQALAALAKGERR